MRAPRHGNPAVFDNRTSPGQPQSITRPPCVPWPWHRQTLHKPPVSREQAGTHTPKYSLSHHPVRSNWQESSLKRADFHTRSVIYHPRALTIYSSISPRPGHPPPPLTLCHPPSPLALGHPASPLALDRDRAMIIRDELAPWTWFRHFFAAICPIPVFLFSMRTYKDCSYVLAGRSLKQC